MKIHRVVQMLGATTSTGKLASDMYDLNYKDYYSKEQDRYIPISHMDFQHLVRAFVKQNDEDVRTDTQEGKVKELKQSLDSSHRAYKMGFERNGRHIEKIKELELENQRLVQQLEHDETVVSKEAYQVMKERADLNSYEAYKYKKLAEDNFISSVNDSETSSVWKERYEKEVNNAEYWKAQYRIANDLLQPNKGCGYVFSEIPNDTDGQEFVDSMKKYLNKDSYKMRVRGQHIKPELRGTGATYWGQSKAESTHMRVYINAK